MRSDLNAEGVTLARDLVVPERGAQWGLAALRGRFGELVGGADSAVLTFAMALVAQVQQAGEPVAWIGRRDAVFYVPDAERVGVDAGALPVVRVRNERETARALEVVLRAGTFGLVVVDVGEWSKFTLAMQTVFVGLAGKSETAVVVLRSDQDRTGSLVSFRGRTKKSKSGTDCFECVLTAAKDKRNTPGWEHRELRCGADGLC